MTQTVLQLALAALFDRDMRSIRQALGRAGGRVTSALPAIAGPFSAARGRRARRWRRRDRRKRTLGGLVILGGFVVAYARAARGHVWSVSLGAGWIVATPLAALVELLEPRAPLGVLLAVSSLLLAQRLMPPGELRSRRARAARGACC